MEDPRTQIQNAIEIINQAWRSGRIADMAEFLHPDIVMKFPKFSGTLAGREKLLAGFEEFAKNANVVEYTESDHQMEIVDNTAVASFRFDMLYERPGYRERSIGRDLWVFQREGEKWLAVWRTMVDLSEVRDGKSPHKSVTT